MNCINEIFIHSLGHNLLGGKTYRRYKTCSENTKLSQIIFSETMQERDKNSNGSTNHSPFFEKNGRYFYFIQKKGLYFIMVSEYNIQPVFAFDVLCSIFQVMQDFLGYVDEETINSNSILVFELLDEIIDNGYLQVTSTDKLQPYIHSEVHRLNRGINTSLVPPHILGIDKKVSEVMQQKSGTLTRDEIFIDVIERLTVLVAKDGKLERIEANGCIKIKNSIQNCHELKLALSEDINVGDDTSKTFGGEVKLNKCMFHPNVDTEQFKHGILKLKPVIGENTVLNYSAIGPIAVHQPFHLHCCISDLEQSNDLLLSVSIQSDIPEEVSAINLEITIPLPASVDNVSHRLFSTVEGEKSKYNKSSSTIVWTIPLLHGQSEVKGQFQLINHTNRTLKKESIGPALLKFEISKYTSTGLKLRHLHLGMGSSANVRRWIRHLTLADSYVFQLGK